jgi:S1-C subfamily serine protease
MVLSPLFRGGTRLLPLLAAALLSVPAVIGRTCDAQQSDARARVREVPAREPRTTVTLGGPGFTFTTDADDERRAVIGIALGQSGRRDTLGVLVDEVTPDGPAAKAGVPEGARIVAINGVNLRVSAADADDPYTRGLGERRLRRELAKVEPGAEIELGLTVEGQARTVRLKTVSAEELTVADRARAPMTRSTPIADSRPFLGLAVGTTGSARDTLGLFVSSVTTDGPAEKAGIVEGDRIQSINGVDVRVPREDAGDWSSSSARANRFTRALRAGTPGDVMTLEVMTGGRTRTVKVTTAKASDFRSGDRGLQMQLGDDLFFRGNGLDGLGEGVSLRVGQALREARESLPRLQLLREPGAVTIRGLSRSRRVSL